MAITGEAPLRVLLIGRGGLEHVLAWELNQSPTIDHVCAMPRNDGTAAGMEKFSNVPKIGADNFPGLVQLATALKTGLVVDGADGAVAG
jgi:phosphoribosylamine-glycine ligase